MSSISVSDYRQACKELLKSAMHRPRMYFETLRELELIMQGHATAFGQLTSMDRGEMFPSQFGDWLYRVKGLSCASGWAYAIEEHCKETGERALNVFNDYVRMFVDEWDPDGKK